MIFQQLLQHQEEHRAAEIASRQCLSGPHKDDLLVEIDGQAAKSYASQGQTRTAALSLKLAAREIFQQDTGSIRCCCWTMCFRSLTPGGRSLY